jgi:ABC-type polysaccharide/polyol phosphate export permease
VPAVVFTVLALSGVGVSIALLSPTLQLTTSLTQVALFYVLFFAPVLLPRDQLPHVLQVISDFLPPSYSADALRATLTDIPGTHLPRSLAMLAIFATASFAFTSAVLRRRA